jgi:hypothetical protein
VAGAACFLAIAALAMMFEDGLRRRFVADRAARASAGIRGAHFHTPRAFSGKVGTGFPSENAT